MTSTSQFDLIVVGDANPDIVLKGAPRGLKFGQAEQLVEQATLTLGGSGAIMAHAAARLGLRTAFVGMLADDPAGRLVSDWLVQGEVNISHAIRRPQRSSAVTVVLVDIDGDRAMLTALGSLADVGADEIDPALLRSTRHVHVASPFLQPQLTAGMGPLLESARSAGATTSLDPNDDPARRWHLERTGILDRVDYLLPNEQEARALVSGPDCEGPSTAGSPNTSDAAQDLAAAGPCVVVKCGAEGALLRDRHHRLRARLPGPPSVPVDTVGAGDAFDAGFITGILDGLTLDQALQFAVAAGTLSTRAAGGIAGQGTRAETERMAARVIVSADEV